MSKLLQVAVAIVLLSPVCAPVPANAAPVEVAVSRCNGQTIDDASSRIREYDRHGPGGGETSLLNRYAAIAEVLATLNEERTILSTICTSDAERAPFFAQIAATVAWALVLEADVAARLNASCPAAASALPTMMLSDAWLALANVVNEDDGTVPASFKEVIPKVQTRAAALALTLPPWAQTSVYWRDQVHAKAKAAVASCPSPSPSPSP